MGDVTPITKNSGPEERFMMCPCTEEPTLITPVVMQTENGPLISSLMCPSCERVIGVVNGYLQEEPQ